MHRAEKGRSVRNTAGHECMEVCDSLVAPRRSNSGELAYRLDRQAVIAKRTLPRRLEYLMRLRPCPRPLLRSEIQGILDPISDHSAVSKYQHLSCRHAGMSLDVPVDIIGNGFNLIINDTVLHDIHVAFTIWRIRVQDLRIQPLVVSNKRLRFEQCAEGIGGIQLTTRRVCAGGSAGTQQSLQDEHGGNCRSIGLRPRPR